MMQPDSPPGEDHGRKVRPLEPSHPSIFTTASSWSCCSVTPPLELSNPPPQKKKCNKEDKRNFQDMLRIKEFGSPRRGVARHADDLPRRAVLSRWLTLEGGAGPGIKADSLPHSSTLKAGLRGGASAAYQLAPPPSSAADAARLSRRPTRPPRPLPPPTATRRLPNSIPNGRLVLLRLEVVD